ncbi:MAG: hypothetical protein AVDCRST_MAG38-1248 [uncultured Solirubrobacteraceae bacterium]|uniref:Uncharacterized protein n=1 Tax=uncultured Solirubrobacteraceae bacterium TaxID=1162706 RepID=A0A6J4RKV6_9ACTN|nr:MAG: hypothetical protein AVDCRST_MAG38-1248 [uncultured Solirubrobacteraceae bacterium]
MQHDRREREDVAARVERAAEQALGARVGARRLGRRDRGGGARARGEHPEAGDAHRLDAVGAGGADDDVVGGEVAVQHAVLVRGFEGVGGAAGDLHGPARREVPLALEQLGEARALDVGGGDVQPAVARGAHPVDERHRGVLHAAGLEHLAHDAAHRRRVRLAALHGEGAQHPARHVRREVDVAGRRLAELPADLVALDGRKGAGGSEGAAGRAARDALPIHDVCCHLRPRVRCRRPRVVGGRRITRTGSCAGPHTYRDPGPLRKAESNIV